jgi:hypothetical protein
VDAAPQKLCFLHIPKTAGTSFGDTARAWFPRFHPISAIFPNNAQILADYDFVWGHVHYEFFRRIPGSAAFKIAVALRDPFENVASYLQMCDRYNDADHAEKFETLPVPLKETVRLLPEVDFSSADALARFMTDLPPCAWGRVAFCNLQTRFLTDGGKPSGVGEAEVRRAMENLRKVDFVMTSEDLDSGIRLVAEAFEKTALAAAPQSNAGTSGRRINLRDPDIRAALAPWIQHDLRLYKFARRTIRARRRGRLLMRGIEKMQQKLRGYATGGKFRKLNA